MSNNSEDVKPWKKEVEDASSLHSNSSVTPTEVDNREQPWKKFMAAEKEKGGDRPWNEWTPPENSPFDKPWLKWSVDFNVDNFRHMTGS